MKDNIKYIEFVNNNNDICKTKKKMLIKLNQTIGNIYVNKNSNNQIKTFLTNAYHSNAIIKIAKFELLLNKFFNKNFVKHLLKLIKNDKSITDKKIINIIVNTTDKIKEPYDKHRINVWTYIFENLCYEISKLNKNINFEKCKYLDIGCGSGSKTLLFANTLNIKQKNINGTDIPYWGPYEQNKYNHKFKFKTIDDLKLNYRDNEFNIITIILTLHHIEKLEEFINEIYRILKKGGLLVLIDHDIHDDYDTFIVDIEHLLYAYLYDKNNDYLNNPNFAQYYNKIEWLFLLNKFKHLKTEYAYVKFEQDVRYDNLFYSLFVK